MTEAHPEPAEIAALGEDLLPPYEAATLQTHLARCPRCSDTAADLAALRSELATLSADVRMPDDVSTRIDRALAAEGSPATEARPAPTDIPQRTMRAPASFVSRETGRFRFRPPLLLAAAGAVAALGIGGLLLQNLQGSGGGDSTAATLMEDSPEAGARGEEDHLAAQVRRLLSEADSGSGDIAEEFSAEPHHDEAEEDSAEEFGTQGRAPTTDAGAMTPGCVLSAIDRGETPLAAGEESYQGTPAYLVVLPHAQDPQQVDAYVVDASCATDSSSEPGEILAQHSYPRN
ncbi:hypothetical protein PJ985_01495 [Streptomyces sp. ACA25]|uniref:anti-sigma factor family protein n=1 Tax=Streptomyces sp. ACA25 TaxID=3022596 RepID=UPI002307D5A0|nr:hypothetical protein [Streptomyces sp. ACA25]MDB1086248.1 hypothetical protein [Streptomyces sp. ACA25]